MDAKAVRDFEHECEIMSTVKSPYIIPFYGSCLEPQVTIVVAYCSHGSLYMAMEDETLDIGWDLMFKWASQMLIAIKTLHSSDPPIYHRDLKTPNLLLNSDWDIQVCDFGNSRLDDADASTLGKVRGTYAYCAPEVYLGSKFTTKSDVYSIAIILWELVERCISGKYLKPYYEHANLTLGYTIIIKTAKNNLRPTFTEKVPPEWRELITRCWDGNPDVRPECGEILDKVTELEKLYKETKAREWDSLRTVPTNISSTNAKRGYLLRTESRRIPLGRDDADDLKGFAHLRLLV